MLIRIGNVLLFGWLAVMFLVFSGVNPAGQSDPSSAVVVLGLIVFLAFITWHTGYMMKVKNLEPDPKIQAQGETAAALLFIATILIVYLLATGQYTPVR